MMDKHRSIHVEYRVQIKIKEIGAIIEKNIKDRLVLAKHWSVAILGRINFELTN